MFSKSEPFKEYAEVEMAKIEIAEVEKKESSKLNRPEYRFGTAIVLSKNIQQYAEDLFKGKITLHFENCKTENDCYRCCLRSYGREREMMEVQTYITYMPLDNFQFVILDCRFKDKRYIFPEPILVTISERNQITSYQQQLAYLDREIDNLAKNKQFFEDIEETVNVFGMEKQIKELQNQQSEYINAQETMLKRGVIKTIFPFSEEEIKKVKDAIDALIKYGLEQCPAHLSLDDELTIEQKKGEAAQNLASQLQQEFNSFIQEASTEGLLPGGFEKFKNQFIHAITQGNDCKTILATNNAIRSTLFSTPGKTELSNLKQAMKELYNQHKTNDVADTNNTSLIDTVKNTVSGYFKR